MRLTLLLTLAAALWAAEPKPAEPKAAAPPPPKVVQLTTTQRLAYQAIMRMLDEVQMEACAMARIAPDRCQVEWQGGLVREVVPPPPPEPPPQNPAAKEGQAR